MAKGAVVATSTPVPVVSAVALRPVARNAPVKTLVRILDALFGSVICAPASAMGMGHSSPVIFQ